MRNTGLDKAEAGIKIAGRNINNLKYADDTTLMAESEEWKCSCSVMSDSSRPHGLYPTRLLHSWDFPSKSTGVDYHCLLMQYETLSKDSVREFSYHQDREYQFHTRL